MTKNRTIDYMHINRPFFFVFFPLFPGDAGVGSRDDGAGEPAGLAGADCAMTGCDNLKFALNGINTV
jgi:hypothetical protein